MLKRILPVLVYSLLTPSIALAQDPGKGMRGPTLTQADARVIYSNNVLTQQYFGKVWTGDGIGVWGVLGASTVQGTEDDGLESLLALGGPRFRVGNLHALTHIGRSFGMREGVDDVTTAGVFATYDFNGEREVTGTLHYLDHDEDPDKYSYGFSYAEKVKEKLQLGLGFTAEQSDGTTFTDARVVARFIPSEEWHVRASFDYPVNNLPTNKSRAEILFRRNLRYKKR